MSHLTFVRMMLVLFKVLEYHKIYHIQKDLSSLDLKNRITCKILSLYILVCWCWYHNICDHGPNDLSLPVIKEIFCTTSVLCYMKGVFFVWSSVFWPVSRKWVYVSSYHILITHLPSGFNTSLFNKELSSSEYNVLLVGKYYFKAIFGTNSKLLWWVIVRFFA